MIKEEFRIQKKPGYALCLVLSLLFTALVLTAAPVSAQQGQELLTAISQQIGKSMQALTGYSYQQRTEVQVNGETKSVQLSQIAFGPDKQPLITPISSEPSEDSGRGLRGRIKKEKAEEMKEEIQGLVQLANRYLMPGQEKMQQLVQRRRMQDHRSGEKNT